MRSNRRPKTRRSARAQPAKQSAPTAPVAVSRAPAAATTATPLEPRISTAVAAPRLGPTGSRPIAAAAINRAIESKKRDVDADALEHEPVADHLRAGGEHHQGDDPVAAPQSAQDVEALPEALGGGAHEAGHRRRSRPPATARADRGTHQGMPSGRDQREREDRRERHLDHDDRQLGRDQDGARGLSAGAERRSAVIRTA